MFGQIYYLGDRIFYLNDFNLWYLLYLCYFLIFKFKWFIFWQ